jgi:hypothetical protein
VNGGLNACGNKLRLPGLTWKGDRVSSDHRSTVHAQELRNEISNIVDAIAQGTLKSSPALAGRLAQTELQLAAEEGRDECTPPEPQTEV